MKISSLGFPVKEMIAGIHYWEDFERYPVKRKQAKRVYYALPVGNTEKTAFYNEKTKEIPPQKLLSTKEISLPKYKANERIPDHIRYEQIKQQEERKQLERDSWL